MNHKPDPNATRFAVPLDELREMVGALPTHAYGMNRLLRWIAGEAYAQWALWS